MMSLIRLVSSPIIEASEIVEKLSGRDDRNLRMTLFSLQKFIRVSMPVNHPTWYVSEGLIDIQEEQFANEFLQRDGLKELMDVISVEHGNTLAVRRHSILRVLFLLRTSHRSTRSPPCKTLWNLTMAGLPCPLPSFTPSFARSPHLPLLSTFAVPRPPSSRSSSRRTRVLSPLVQGAAGVNPLRAAVGLLRRRLLGACIGMGSMWCLRR